jgi:hypothetical protein
VTLDAWDIVRYVLNIGAPIAVTFLVKHWTSENEKANKRIEERFDNLHENLSALNEKMNRIEIRIATAGLDTIPEDIRSLTMAKVKSEEQIRSIWQVIGLKKRKVDHSEN